MDLGVDQAAVVVHADEDDLVAHPFLLPALVAMDAMTLVIFWILPSKKTWDFGSSE